MDLFFEEAEEFADPEHEGGCTDDDEPIIDAELCYVEELTTEGHDQHLTYKDEEGYEYEASAILEMESRFACLECTGVEHIPEMQEY